MTHCGRAVVVTSGKDGSGELKVRPAASDLTGLRALADAMLASASLTAIDLAENQLGAGGGQELTAAIAASPSPSQLRRVDLRENYLHEGYAIDARGQLSRTSDENVERVLMEAAGERMRGVGGHAPLEVIF